MTNVRLCVCVCVCVPFHIERNTLSAFDEVKLSTVFDDD